MTSEAKVSTGDCMVTSTPNQKTIHALASSMVSLNCEKENVVLSPPSRSVASRRVRTFFSRSLRNHAFFGPLGIKRKKPIPAATVSAPQIMNKTRHGAMVRDLFFPMPYISKQPITWATPFMVIQRAVRTVCSFLLYQILVMVTNAGETAPSLNPSRNRTAAKPA